MTAKPFLPPFKEFLREHLVWILSLSPFVLVGIKLLSNSDGNIIVFRYLLQNANIAALLMASVVPLIPLVAFWIIVLAIEWVIQTPREQRQINIPDWLYLPLFGATPVIALLMPLSTRLINITLVVVLIGVRRLFRWLRRNDDVDPLRDSLMRSDGSAARRGDI